MDYITLVSLIFSVLGAVLAVIALIYAYVINKRTEKTQQYMENIFNHLNFINTYTFLCVRNMTEDKAAKDNHKIILRKDTIIFIKSAKYSPNNSKVCWDIIFHADILKSKVYGNTIRQFLDGDLPTLHITLRSRLSLDDIKRFSKMSADLLQYDISVLHNNYF